MRNVARQKIGWVVAGALCAAALNVPPCRVYGNCMPRVASEIDVLEIAAGTTSR